MINFFLFLLLTLSLFADFGVKTRVELHGKYQNLYFDLQDYTLYGRLEKASAFAKGWELYLRLDIPFIDLWGKRTEFVELDYEGIVDETKNPVLVPKKCHFRSKGLADILTKAFFVTPSKNKVCFGFGSELVFPTAQEPEIGTGKYSARPMVGIRYDLSELKQGAWTAFLAKYQFSFAGDPKRPNFRIFFMQPVFILPFYNSWTLSFTPECQWNCKTNEWFVPFSIAIAKSVSRCVFSLQYQKSIVAQFPVFNQEVEATLAYFF